MLGFLKTINVGAVISVVKWGAVIALLTLALTTFRQWRADEQAEQDALIQANADKATQQARAQELENANTQLEAALQITRESVRASNEAITELREQNRIAQQEAERQRSVLSDVDRLQAIANRRTSLLERMVNRATKERFDELEAILNED